VFTASVVFLLASPVCAALKQNDVAPIFSLRDVKGRDFNLSDVVGPKSKDKASGVILSFFASWCAECRSELPLINSLVDELNGKGIKVVLVDVKEDVDTINALLAELKVEKPIVLSDRHGKTADDYGVRFLPVTFFIGSDARVKHIIFGKIIDAKEFRESAGKLLP
jgi:thiol-disulfide isomerase/thioredoxin